MKSPASNTRPATIIKQCQEYTTMHKYKYRYRAQAKQTPHSITIPTANAPLSKPKDTEVDALPPDDLAS